MSATDATSDDPAPPAPSHFHLFVYGTLRSNGGEVADPLASCERIGPASVPGTLYDIDGRFPALVRAGNGANGHRVEGELWRCPAERLRRLDRHEAVSERLFRRVALRAGGRACWTYVAGPALAPKITPERRIASGTWVRAGAS